MRKRSLILLLTCTALLLYLPAATVQAAQMKQAIVETNGAQQETTIVVDNNYQLVPAITFRQLGALVSWNEQYRSAVIQMNGTTISYRAGLSHTDYARSGTDNWLRDTLPVKVTNDAGRVYVPLGYTARKLGVAVEYDAKSKSTTLARNGKTVVIHSVTDIETKLAASSEELKWLYQVTEAEAGGESYTGKVAVAASILNRVKHPEWPDTIIDTIFQVTTFNGKSYYQYSPVLDKRIYQVKPSADTKKAVQAALQGEDPSKGAIVFYNPDKTDNQWVRSREKTIIIGNHVFTL
ncbi:hypothetical protein EBB07_17725 [Paenibacillaceae bacterium]|nr:hypothetical protein EBB07_17725 [Paenibacillaceae bacterium]